ncbi:MAG: MaoC family dehydratase [Rhodobacteraceae bacterium]|nr:MaoC family dehydratase [Paracoccaceae bacterium]
MIAVVQDLKDSVGIEIGLSSWITINQAMIDAFAAVTGDHQFIHTDPKAAELTSLGGTIAHGFLILSLLPKMIQDCAMQPRTQSTGVNYGLDDVRFVAPVPVGARIRGRFVLNDYVEPHPGVRKLCWDVTVEIEGKEKPALVAKWRALRVERKS